MYSGGKSIVNKSALPIYYVEDKRLLLDSGKGVKEIADLSGLEKMRLAEARSYSEALVEHLKFNEGCVLTLYNNGQTIGYGFDIINFPDIKINYKEDGSISHAEAVRLLIIVLDQTQKNINNFLDNNDLQIDQNTFDALIDLFYNRGSNHLTQEIALAMAMKNNKKVLELFADFDYRYAYTYIYKNIKDDKIRAKEAQAYVDRNPELKIRREWEYSIYINGFK